MCREIFGLFVTDFDAWYGSSAEFLRKSTNHTPNFRITYQVSYNQNFGLCWFLYGIFDINLVDTRHICASFQIEAHYQQRPKRTPGIGGKYFYYSLIQILSSLLNIKL